MLKQVFMGANSIGFMSFGSKRMAAGLHRL
ncbi:hypothetical protein O987_15120 [Comamonas testosteroni TK102]|uniref:Uncharacterized protein n=1 Tax=Comamonas testosteroni TK102 TaxID=1392005 RepID=A0A076PN04_COMTE|nr:hypothetical protein O987_15120 [Comamonas testosteroni TK102]